ncbi:MAG: septal ring lytic transglycosylase RlpA family protein [bacterium]
MPLKITDLRTDKFVIMNIMKQKAFLFVLFTTTIFIFTGCPQRPESNISLKEWKEGLTKETVDTHNGKTSSGSTEEGYASYYGAEFDGKETASGEIYNMYDLTCAHRSLPFGTKLKVTNTENGKSVIVRINDRGPWVKDRIIDLSYQSAKEIGMIDTGIAWVKIKVIK